MFLTTLHRYGREQPGDGRARADDVAHAHARIRSSREVAWSTGLQLVTHDTQSADAVRQPFERCALKLRETRGNQSARSPENRIELVCKTDVQAVGKQMAAAKFPRLAYQLIERESH